MNETTLEGLSKKALLEIIYSAYQAVGAIVYETGLLDNDDVIRLQDVLAYGKTEDGIELLPFPKNPLVPKGSNEMSECSEYCSFCGKHETDVERLIDGPRVAICNECINLMHDDMLPHQSQRELRPLEELRKSKGS